MKKVNSFLILSILMFASHSCTTNQLEPAVNIEQRVCTTIADSTPHNDAFAGIAQTVSRAMAASSDFRALLKEKALEKFDGDYDIMLSSIKQCEVSDYPSTRGKEGSISVAEMFDELFPIDTRSLSPQNIIETLSEMFPQMQISIPVHAEEWEVGYIPTVVFLDESYQENVTQFVRGYDAGGNEVWVDAINEPDVPVIVISSNERGCTNVPTSVEEIVATRSDTSEILPRPSNLCAIFTGSRIDVDWDFDISNVSSHLNTVRFCYKKKTDDNYYSRSNGYDTSATIYDVDYKSEYMFKVEAYWEGGIITTSDVLTFNPASGMSSPLFARSDNPNSLVLTWYHDSPFSIDYVDLYRKDVAYDTTALGTLIASNLDRNILTYSDVPPICGRRYIYTLQAYSDSVAIKTYNDIIYQPYRNNSLDNDVYITQMSYTSSVSDFEAWLHGAPEFRVSYALVHGNTMKVFNNSDLNPQGKFYNFTSRSAKTCTFTSGHKLLSWKSSDRLTTHDKLVLLVGEKDYDNVDTKRTVNASIELKGNIAGVSFDFGTLDLSFDIDTADKNMGSYQHSYYENPNKTLDFNNNYGFALVISENP